MAPRIALIVVMDRHRLIGAEGTLPWRLPDDARRFKALTMGKPVIMGRRTYESIPTRFRPLTGRHNIVVTRDPAYVAPGCTVVHTTAEALAAAGDVDEVMIAGGAALYAAFLPEADRLYLTLVHGDFSGDTYFPPIDWSQWREVAREEHPADERHAWTHTFLILERRAQPTAAHSQEETGP